MIYLDHNATTPILPEVLEAMMPSKEVDSLQSTVNSQAVPDFDCEL